MLEIKDLKKCYGTLDVLKNINIKVKQGEVVCIIGPSGSGKSTLLRCMNLLERPDEGEILYKGKNILKIKKKEERQIHMNIGMVFQHFNLFPLHSVLENVTLAPVHNKGMKKAEAREKVLEMFRKLGIPDPEERIDCYPHQFSGGMKQRVVIAIAMICNPELIICDEPTTALDVTIQAQIMELLKSLQVNEGKSIILITHNMGLVAEMADEVCVMYMGRVVEFGSLEDIFDHTSHPYTKALLRSVPVLGLGDDQKLETIPGVTPNPADLKEGCEFADRCSECMEKCRKGKIPAFEVSPGHKVRCLKFDSYPEVK